jgi:hypothetical protein
VALYELRRSLSAGEEAFAAETVRRATKFLLVEMGGLGPFITMNLAKVPKAAKLPEGSAAKKTARKQPSVFAPATPPVPLEPQRPRLIHWLAR